jgi:two-component system cell cycle sensor histidine kinase/response regulator CckA
MSSGPNTKSEFPIDEHASGRFLAAVGGVDEAELVHFRALVASESYTIAALDLNHTIVSWSRGGEALFGYAAAEVVGRNFALLLTGVDEALAQLKPRVALGETVELDAKLRHADGQVVHSFLTATPVRAPEGSVVGTGLIIRDVGHTKEAERRLREASEVDALGRTAAGVAHELNNVLAAVRAYGEFVAEGPLTARQEADLKAAQEAAQRGALLTGQLLSLKRQNHAEPQDVDLNDVLRAMENLLRRSVGRSIDLRISLSVSPLRVRSVPGKFDRILLSLVLNGRDALPSGGRLEISLEEAQVAADHPLLVDARGRSHAKLVVRDTGVGMDAETRRRIFDPFFTTKVSDRPGLGLLVVKEAARELGGSVVVESALDSGTTFTVLLPLVQPQRVTLAPAQSKTVAGTATLLVIESDAGLRSAVSRILRGAGYSTLEAASPSEAQALLDARGEPVDAVISDLATASGKPSLLDHGDWPNTRRIYLSGDARRTVDDGAVLVAKPFAASDLLDAVSKLLARRPNQPSIPVVRAPVALIVDPDEELAESLARLLKESDLEAHTTRTGLHALQLLKKMTIDVLITDQFMPGIEGTRLLELACASYPKTARILFTAEASPDVVVNAVNRGRVAKVLLKSMHPVAIRDEIAAVATETMRRQVRSSSGSG